MKSSVSRKFEGWSTKYIIKVTYPGGYDKDGTLILHKGDYITDEELPKIGENYIFVGIGQPNRTILLQIYILILHIQKKIKKNTWTILIIKRMNRERFKYLWELEKCNSWLTITTFLFYAIIVKDKLQFISEIGLKHN